MLPLNVKPANPRRSAGCLRAICDFGNTKKHGVEFGSWLTKIVYAVSIAEGAMMLVPLFFVMTGSAVVVLLLIWERRRARRREMLNHTITPEALHALLNSDHKPAVVDLRVPLDFLVHTEIIPGAQRISPKEIVANPNMLSRERDYVLYCTCPGEVSGEAVLAAAQKMGFLRIKVLAGGLEAWKQRGYPVIPYDKPFRLDA